MTSTILFLIFVLLPSGFFILQIYNFIIQYIRKISIPIRQFLVFIGLFFVCTFFFKLISLIIISKSLIQLVFYFSYLFIGSFYAAYLRLKRLNLLKKIDINKSNRDNLELFYFSFYSICLGFITFEAYLAVFPSDFPNEIKEFLLLNKLYSIQIFLICFWSILFFCIVVSTGFLINNTLNSKIDPLYSNLLEYLNLNETFKIFDRTWKFFLNFITRFTIFLFISLYFLFICDKILPENFLIFWASISTSLWGFLFLFYFCCFVAFYIALFFIVLFALKFSISRNLSFPQFLKIIGFILKHYKALAGLTSVIGGGMYTGINYILNKDEEEINSEFPSKWDESRRFYIKRIFDMPEDHRIISSNINNYYYKFLNTRQHALFRGDYYVNPAHPNFKKLSDLDDQYILLLMRMNDLERAINNINPGTETYSDNLKLLTEVRAEADMCLKEYQQKLHEHHLIFKRHEEEQEHLFRSRQYVQENYGIYDHQKIEDISENDSSDLV